MKKLLIIMIIILLVLPKMFADAPKADSLKSEAKPVLGLGVGLLYQVSIHTQYKNHYICARYYSFPPIFGGGFFNETALLYGRTLNFNSRTKGYIATAIGISHNHTKLLDENEYFKEKHTVGIPIDLSLTKGISSFLGYGINLTVNINEHNPFGGAFLSLYLGDFRNDNYEPAIEKKQATKDPSFLEYKQSKNRELSIDWNWLYYLWTEQNGHKFNVCLSSDKVDWIFAMHYCDYEYNDILGKYNSQRSISLKARKYVSKKRYWYFDAGFKHTSLHHNRWDIGEEEYWHKTIFAHLSAGNIDYISNNFYIKTQLNMLFPISGDDIDFNGYGMNSGAFIMNFELLSIGYTFRDHHN